MMREDRLLDFENTNLKYVLVLELTQMHCKNSPGVELLTRTYIFSFPAISEVSENGKSISQSSSEKLTTVSRDT